MKIYIYQADCYCEDCGRRIGQDITLDFYHPNFAKRPENPQDETTYDSDDYPKGPYSPSEADSPQHCGSGENCLNVLEINGKKYGCWLENPLASDGIDYILNELALLDPVKKNDILDFWMEMYKEQFFKECSFIVQSKGRITEARR